MAAQNGRHGAGRPRQRGRIPHAMGDGAGRAAEKVHRLKGNLRAYAQQKNGAGRAAEKAHRRQAASVPAFCRPPTYVSTAKLLPK